MIDLGGAAGPVEGGVYGAGGVARGAVAMPVVELRGVTKRFAGVVANDDVSLSLAAGEVHCLLGENGAGKSTLVALLSGMLQPDEGAIVLDGVAGGVVGRGGGVVGGSGGGGIASPRAAIDFGIGVVAQHSTLVPTLTVLENVMLGDFGRLRLDRVSANERLAELGELLGTTFAADRLAGDLPLGEQQLLEIARALRAGSRVLVLDEPTSLLAPAAIEVLLMTVRCLAERGIAVVLITHKLGEALAVGDRVTVLRAGRVAATLGPAELGTRGGGVADEILAAMFGGAAGGTSEADAGGSRADRGDRGAVRLTLREVTVIEPGAVGLNGLSLEVRAGEILGVAGIAGQGQRALAEVISGERLQNAGTVTLDGRDLGRLGVRARHELGVRSVTDDRLREGIVGTMSVALNLVLKRIGRAPLWRRGVIDRPAIDAEARSRIAEVGVRPADPGHRAGTLSGGNMQKLLLARELAHDPQVVVFHQPTAGLDLHTVRLVRTMIRDFAAGGGAAIVISSDLDELVQLSGRVVVLARGAISGEVETGGVDRVGKDTARQIAELMAEVAR